MPIMKSEAELRHPRAAVEDEAVCLCEIRLSFRETVAGLSALPFGRACAAEAFCRVRMMGRAHVHTMPSDELSAARWSG
jgi:hypothetical protein